MKYPMVLKTRYSKYFPNPLSNQLGIVHRQGQDYGFIPLALLTIYWISSFVTLARSIQSEINFLSFAIFIFSGFVLYLIITILMRNLFYLKIVHYQGIFHPKLAVVIVLFLLQNMFYQSQSYVMVLYILGILVTIDVILQNQIHDTISTIGPNKWEVNSPIPIFQIPFEKDISMPTDDQNQYNVAIKIRRKRYNPFATRYMSSEEIQNLIENGGDNSDIYSYSVYLIDGKSSSTNVNNKEKIEVYRTQEMVQLQELLFELNSLIKLKFVGSTTNQN